jgi:hypothetical protein
MGCDVDKPAFQGLAEHALCLFQTSPAVSAGILLANLLHRYKAEISAGPFPSLGAFKEVKGEAKF